MVHQKLQRFRVSYKREFFQLSLKEAIQIVSQALQDANALTAAARELVSDNVTPGAEVPSEDTVINNPEGSLRLIPRGENASVILEAVHNIVGNDFNRTFTPRMVVQEINKMGYKIPDYTAYCHIMAASPNHKQTTSYTGYRDKYWWIKGSGLLNAEFRMLDPNAPNQAPA